ncbi:MAG: DUF559 domain-containing protein [Crocinitomicaceae bacterium]
MLSKKQTQVRFLRQIAISNYIADFFSLELDLITEVDGSSHVKKGIYDERRQNSSRGRCAEHAPY